MNSKNYGVPQNRERTFMVSLYGNYSYEFPKPIELKWRLKDYLQKEVEDKYYLTKKVEDFFENGEGKYQGSSSN